MGSGRLIIVDDEPVILNLLVSIFDDEPWDVISCADGTAALQAMKEQGVDVLLTDKNLPDIGGLELLRYARRAPGRLRGHHHHGLRIPGHRPGRDAASTPSTTSSSRPKTSLMCSGRFRQAFDKIRMGRENRRLMNQLTEQNVQLQDALSELKGVQAELIQSEKLAGIGTLAAGIAHEISSPLFGVMGLAEAIVDEEDRELVQGYAKEIVDYSRTIKEIVVQLSGYSRTAEREYYTTVPLGSVAADAARLVTRSLSIDPERVEVIYDEDLLINAKANEVQQVFVNLIKNAVEAVVELHGDSDQGRVVVRCWDTENGARAEVRDNGAGIPEEQCSVIFDPFYTTKPPGRGTGLGLNIVYRIMARYRGSVSVRSAVGDGTTFELQFPHRDGS